MSVGTIRKIETAKAVADFLASIGENKRAEDVRSLARCTRSLHDTASRLHADNAKLRGS